MRKILLKLTKFLKLPFVWVKEIDVKVKDFDTFVKEMSDANMEKGDTVHLIDDEREKVVFKLR